MIKKLTLLVTVFFLGVADASAKMLDIQEFTTPGGIKVWFVEDKSMPLMALSFAFKTGPEANPVNKQGLTQLLSNTMDEGAGNLDAKTFQDALRNNAISLSFGSARDEYSGSLHTLLRHKDEAVNLLKLALEKPRFDAEAVERMRKANLSRVRSSMSDADWIASRILYDRIYKGHPYAFNSGGTIESLSKITSGDLKAEWKRIAARDRLVIGLTGNLTKDEASKIVDDAFAAIPAKSAEAKLDKAVMPDAGKPVFYAKEMPQTVLNMAWEGIGIHDPDYYAAIVMDYIFGSGGFTSRLMTEVREKRGLTYGIGSDMLDNDYADRYLVSGSMLPQNVAPTIDIVKQIASSLKETNVTADELAGAKQYLTGSLPLSLGSSGAIASTLTGLQSADRPITALDDYHDKINAITAADVKRVAARIFAKDPIIVMVGATPEKIEFDTLKTLPNTEKTNP